MAATERTVTQLVPTTGEQLPVSSLYLQQRIGHSTSSAPWIYANFTASLDGRIAVAQPDTAHHIVPAALASAIDWDLFTQLQAHADCLVTHGGYLRALARGQHGNILQIGVRPAQVHLAQWRKQQGWHEQPAVVILSMSLDFELPETLRAHAQRVTVLTGSTAPDTRADALARQGCTVLRRQETFDTSAGDAISGPTLAACLTEHGYQRVYIQAGPDIVRSLIQHRLLARFYLTQSHCLLAGDEATSLMQGPCLANGQMRLVSLYASGSHAAASTDTGPGQFFMGFDCEASMRPQSQTTER